MLYIALGNLFEMVAILICISYVYGQKFKINFMMFFVIVIDMILVVGINSFGMSRQFTWCIYPILLFYCIKQYGFKLKEIVINMVLIMLTLSIFQFALMLVYTWITSNYFIDNKTCMMINVVTLIFVVFILKKCRLHQFSLYLQDKSRVLTVAVCTVTIGIILLLFYTKQFDIIDIRFFVIFYIALILIAVLTVNLGKYRVRSLELEAQLKANKMYEDSYKSLIDEIRLKQHEFDNHINTIYSQHYIYQTFEELVQVQREYCKAIEKDNYYNKLLSNGNSVLIGFLYGKFLWVKAQGIILEYKVKMQEFTCSLPVYKGIELLNDMINNAAEYLMQSQTYERMFVSVIETEKEIFLKVENECDLMEMGEIQQIFEKGFSKKGEGRGLGLYNVKRICTEYHLKLSCDNQEKEGKNWIRFYILINK